MNDDQTRGLQRITQFTPLADVLARIAASVRPVHAQSLEPAAAVGHTLAQDIRLEISLPSTAIALRDGWAVKAELTSDASPYAPSPIPTATWIEFGSALGPEQDAVLPIEGVSIVAGVVQAVAPVTAGDGVLSAGGDLPPGSRTLRAGRRISYLQAGLLQAAGLGNVPVHIPRMRLTHARAGADWVIDTVIECIADAVHSSGSRTTTGNEGFEDAFVHTGSDAIIVIGGSGCGHADRVVRTLASMGELIVHGVGLVPGDTAAFAMVEGRPVLVLPGRLDGALAAWHMLGRAILQKLAGSTEPLLMATAELTHKISSPGGLAELVPVHCDGRTATPLASGYLPAGILAQANGWIFIGPESEGYAAGSEVAVRPWP
jgi:molybdopterin biosynthesis enzyme